MRVFVTELNGIMARIFCANSLTDAKRCARAEMVICGYYPRLEMDAKYGSIVTRPADPAETALFYAEYAKAAADSEDEEIAADMDYSYGFTVFPAMVLYNKSKPVVWWTQAERDRRYGKTLPNP